MKAATKAKAATKVKAAKAKKKNNNKISVKSKKKPKKMSTQRNPGIATQKYRQERRRKRAKAAKAKFSVFYDRLKTAANVALTAAKRHTIKHKKPLLIAGGALGVSTILPYVASTVFTKKQGSKALINIPQVTTADVRKEYEYAALTGKRKQIAVTTGGILLLSLIYKYGLKRGIDKYNAQRRNGTENITDGTPPLPPVKKRLRIVVNIRDSNGNLARRVPVEKPDFLFDIWEYIFDQLDIQAPPPIVKSNKKLPISWVQTFTQTEILDSNINVKDLQRSLLQSGLIEFENLPKQWSAGVTRRQKPIRPISLHIKEKYALIPLLELNVWIKDHQ